MALLTKKRSEAEAAEAAGVVEESYPLNLTADQMRTSNPSAVAEIEQAASEKARADTKRRMKEMQAAFPTDPDFAFESFADGLTVEQAKAQRHDVLEAENAELRQKLEHATKQIEGAIVSDASSETEDAGPSTEGKKPTDPSLSFEEATELAWRQNTHDCRDEFANIDDFRSFAKREPEEAGIELAD